LRHHLAKAMNQYDALDATRVLDPMPSGQQKAKSEAYAEK
jgi:hypothetical protein